MNGKTDNRKPLLVAIVMLGLLLCSTEAFSAINNADVMDTVLNRFKTNASSWASIIENVATRLFWTLALISMVWTFGMMALRKADIGEFFAEVVRFTVFTGFFWWLLVNGPNFAVSIIDSLMQVGGSAAAMGGYSGSFSPSSIVDIGFILFGKTLGESSMWSPVDSMVGIVLGLGILILTAMIAVNILLLLISAWILAYGGIFFLGFGGARWTHDMAINFYKAVLGIAIQIMTMILLIGIGVSLINDYYTNMQTKIEFSEMAVVLIVTLTIFMLSNKVPQLLSGIITGAPSGMGIGQFGAGAVVGAAGVAASAATMAGSMASFGATSGVTQIAGGASALMAAFSQANANVAAGSDVLANAFSGSGGDDGGPDGGAGGDGGGGGGGGMPGNGETPFAKAAGFDNQTSGDSESSALAQSDSSTNGLGGEGKGDGSGGTEGWPGGGGGGGDGMPGNGETPSAKAAGFDNQTSGDSESSALAQSDSSTNGLGGEGKGDGSGGTEGWPGGGGGGSGGMPGNGETPFAKAAGFDNQTSGDSESSALAQSDSSTNGLGGEGRGDGSGGAEGESKSEKTGEGAQGNTAGANAGSGGVLASAGMAAATATRVGADTAANLAKGAMDVAKEKIGSVVDSAKERIADTTGGRIANAIRAMEADSSGNADNSIAVDPNQVDAESEIAAFVNRDNDSKSA